MIKIQELTQTCDACPAQWEGTTDDGRAVYVRFRWGYLSVCLSPQPSEDVDDAVGGDEVFGAQLSDDMDGWLSYDRLRQTAADFIQWPA